jgi:hypothetical protein
MRSSARPAHMLNVSTSDLARTTRVSYARVEQFYNS